jgi:hypothetical protein
MKLKPRQAIKRPGLVDANGRRIVGKA